MLNKFYLIILDDDKNYKLITANDYSDKYYKRTVYYKSFNYNKAVDYLNKLRVDDKTPKFLFKKIANSGFIMDLHRFLFITAIIGILGYYCINNTISYYQNNIFLSTTYLLLSLFLFKKSIQQLFYGCTSLKNLLYHQYTYKYENNNMSIVSTKERCKKIIYFDYFDFLINKREKYVNYSDDEIKKFNITYTITLLIIFSLELYIFHLFNKYVISIISNEIIKYGIYYFIGGVILVIILKLYIVFKNMITYEK